MKKLKTINMCVGIYDSESTITRHKNGNVTIKIPYIKWIGNTGFLAFNKLLFAATDKRTKTLSNDIFTDNDDHEYESLCEFLSVCCTDIW